MVTTIRFYCDLCKKTIAANMTEAFQEEFMTMANKWPYPLIIPHEGHYAIVALDENLKERGVMVTKALLPS